LDPDTSMVGRRNFLCSYCNSVISVGWEEADPARCPTANCTRPVGFGRNAQHVARHPPPGPNRDPDLHTK